MPCATRLMHSFDTAASLGWCCVAGSKVAITSVLHMTWEMAAIIIGYGLWQCWAIHMPGNKDKTR